MNVLQLDPGPDNGKPMRITGQESTILSEMEWILSGCRAMYATHVIELDKG
jgi:hypothetical protein